MKGDERGGSAIKIGADFQKGALWQRARKHVAGNELMIATRTRLRDEYIKFFRGNASPKAFELQRIKIQDG